MKQFEGFAEAKEEAKKSSMPKLPVGCYILKILNVKIEEGKDGFNDKLILAFDIDEGEQKGYFKKKFDSDTSENKKWKGTYRITIPGENDGEDKAWIKKKFAEAIGMFEDSNKGYAWDWDEQKLKNKKVGGVFGEVQKVIEGKDCVWTECRWLDSVENIKNGVSKVPERKVFSSVSSSAPATDNDGFLSMADAQNVVADLPF